MIAILGQGYVGLALTRSLLEKGLKVYGIDTSVEKVNIIKNSDEFQSALSKQRYEISDTFEKIGDSNVVVIAVPTGLNSNGEVDLSNLINACQQIATNVKPGTLIINESTSYVGTLRGLIKPTITNERVEELFFAVAPERVDPGNHEFDLHNTPRLVAGLDSTSTKKAKEFYELFCNQVIEVETPEIAESAKLLENSFRLVNIAFINELALRFSEAEIDPIAVIEAASSKPYGFMKFLPSFGIGGHCIPVDPVYLQKVFKESGGESQFLNLALKLNKSHAIEIVKKLKRMFGTLKEKRIMIIGVTYKPNTADIRHSPAVELATELLSRGAEVEWVDPLVSSFLNLNMGHLNRNYDFAILMQNHSNFDYSDLKCPIVSLGNIFNKDTLK